MADASTDSNHRSRPTARPGENMRLVEALQYRLPLAGVVSILHRASGLILFALLPFIIWMFDLSVSSISSYDQLTAVFVRGWGWLPGWLLKLVCLALIWAYLHHFMAGVRHLWMDMTHSVSKEAGRLSAQITLGLSIVLTLALAGRLFAWY